MVKPGGHVVVADFVTDDDGAGAAWQEQIERLRDPSHWALLTPTRIAALGERVGLEPELDQIAPFEIDYDEWLNRGSGWPDQRRADRAPAGRSAAERRELHRQR